MPDPASEEQLVAELTKSLTDNGETEHDISRRVLWLRSALRSHLAWAAEKAKPGAKEEVGEYTQHVAEGWNAAIDEYRANLMKLTEGV